MKNLLLLIALTVFAGSAHSFTITEAMAITGDFTKAKALIQHNIEYAGSRCGATAPPYASFGKKAKTWTAWYACATVATIVFKNEVMGIEMETGDGFLVKDESLWVALSLDFLK